MIIGSASEDFGPIERPLQEVERFGEDLLGDFFHGLGLPFGGG